MPGILKNAESSLGKRKRSRNTEQSTEDNAGKQARLRDDGDSSEGGAASHSGDEDAEDDTSVEDSGEDEERARDIFRRAFERKFAPLAHDGSSQSKSLNLKEPSVEHSGENDEWEGFDSDDASASEDEQDRPAIHIINHASNAAEDEFEDAYTIRTAKRAFMTSKPPSSAPTTARPTHPSDPNEDAKTAQEHLKNDLALSRLIQESHLLSKTPSSSRQTSRQDFQGRLKTTESRLAALGAKDSVLKQRNVPAAIRTGIRNKQREREEKRRLEARENGIVLEKERVQKVSGVEKRRERSVGNPGIGKFRGGMLTLSQSDLGRLTTPKGVPRKGRGGKGTSGRRKLI